MDLFRTCGACGRCWERWQDFVHDPAVALLGLQVVPGLPDANLVVFQHACGSTVSVLANRLRHLLVDEPATGNLPVLYGTEACNGHCRYLEDLRACDRPCVNARDRRLILTLGEMMKSRSEPGG